MAGGGIKNFSLMSFSQIFWLKFSILNRRICCGSWWHLKFFAEVIFALFLAEILNFQTGEYDISRSGFRSFSHNS